MNGKEDFSITRSLDAMRGGYASVFANASKIIALIALLVAALVSFTDVSFSEFGSAGFTSSLLVMLISSYVIYFSLEDAGERLGEESLEFLTARERYKCAKEKISPSSINALRNYLIDYSKREREWRQTSYLAERGLSDEDIKFASDKSRFTRADRRALRKAAKFKCTRLTPSVLLSSEGGRKRSELENPSRTKLAAMLLKLIPTTVCTFFTVSVMLTTKDGLTAEAVMEAILKLSALPVIAFRGYLSGYEYAKGAGVGWLETKTALLESFIAETYGEQKAE